MSIFSDLFAGGIAGILKPIGDIIDNVSTSDEERLNAKIKLEQIVRDAEAKARADANNYEHELTDRLKADMGSDVWLAKNVRPLTLIGLTLFTMFLAYTSVFGQIEAVYQPVLEQWVNLLTALDLTAFGFYFGGRGLEKIVKTYTNKATK